jgi:NitT/TauT family transport system permease protein
MQRHISLKWTTDASRGTKRSAPNWRAWLKPFVPVFGVMIVLALWQGIVSLRLYPEFIIPSPASVGQRFIDVLNDGRLWLHTRTTLGQMLVGFALGATIGVALGYAMAKKRWLEHILSPIITTLQSTPIVAYAPLLIIWFGSGSTSKIITSALIVFFPLLLNTIVGVRMVSPEQRELMRLFNASGWDMFWRLEVPSALPVMLGALKVSATLAVIGAVVGEFISANAGLGYLINRANFDYDTPLMVVAVLTLAVLARLLYGTAAWLERRALRWRERQ